jgi:hypothetical protein
MAFPTPDYYLFTDEDKRKLPTSQERGGLVALKSELTITAAALVTGAVSRILWVPAGFQLWAAAARMADLDTGAALVYDIGWRAATTAEDDQDGIFAGKTVGQSVGQLHADDMALVGVGYTFVYDSDIVFTCTTQGSASQAGACKFALLGTMP